MTNNLLLEKIKEIEKQLKKLPKKPKNYNANEALEILQKTILTLYKTKDYKAKDIVKELENFGLKTSLRKINCILKKAEEEIKND